MDLPEGLLPVSWLWAGHVLYGTVLAVAAARAPWSRFRDNELQHVFLGACVVLLLLWSIRAGITPGLGFHFLGATVFTLMFGWQLAVIGLSLVLAGVTFHNAADWLALPLNALATVVVPVMVSHGVYRLVDRYLPNHFFVYIFLCAFLGAGVALAANAGAWIWLLTASGVYPMKHVAYEYLPFLPLIVLPEAVLNGMIATALVGLRPRWVVTFDDDRYLKGR